MQRVLSIVATLSMGLLGSLVATSGAAQERESLRETIYSLCATFDDQQGHVGFFHDVNVRIRSERLMLRVIKDVVPADHQRENVDATASKKNDGINGGIDPAWRRRPDGQEPWLSRGRSIHGSVSGDGLRFGFTAMRDGELLSFHFIGKPTPHCASGKVFCLPTRGPVLEGRWELHQPTPQAFPIGPSMKGVTAGNG